VLNTCNFLEPVLLVEILKSIKHLSTNTSTLEVLQNANAIEILTDVLGRHMAGPQSKVRFPILSKRFDYLRGADRTRLTCASGNLQPCTLSIPFPPLSLLPIARPLIDPIDLLQILQTLFNLCRLNRSRQEEAAQAGVVPLLKRIVKGTSQLKQFALPFVLLLPHSCGLPLRMGVKLIKSVDLPVDRILLDFASAGKSTRMLLWQNQGLQSECSPFLRVLSVHASLTPAFCYLRSVPRAHERSLLARLGDGSDPRLVRPCFL
jgi:hypothetical protein